MYFSELCFWQKKHVTRFYIVVFTAFVQSTNYDCRTLKFHETKTYFFDNKKWISFMFLDLYIVFTWKDMNCATIFIVVTYS